VFYSVFNGNERNGANFMPKDMKISSENVEFSDRLWGGIPEKRIKILGHQKPSKCG
jgi:hypothetical protein